MPLKSRSAVTPGWNGTTSVTGFEGKASAARAKAGAKTEATQAATAADTKARRDIVQLLQECFCGVDPRLPICGKTLALPRTGGQSGRSSGIPRGIAESLAAGDAEDAEGNTITVADF